MSACAPSAASPSASGVSATAAAVAATSTAGSNHHPSSTSEQHAGLSLQRRDDPDATANFAPAATLSGSSSSSSGAVADSTRPHRYPSPASRLYRHALESILAFSDLNTLLAAMCVSKEWLGAVGSMRPLALQAECRSALIESVAASAVARHVADLNIVVNVRMDADEAGSIALCMPHLRRLQCWVPLLPVDGPLVFPAGLRDLELLALDDTVSAAEINVALEGASRLEQLEHLSLRLKRRDPLVTLGPLVALPHLQRLSLFADGGASDADLSDAWVAELRALPRLHAVSIGDLTIGDLRRLLAQPHSLQWQQVSLPMNIGHEIAALLTQLPSLTRLTEYVGCERFEWLRGLPNLTEIDMWLDETPAAEGRAASLVAGLAHCAAVTELALGGATDITAAHFMELLPRLPRLRSLLLKNLAVDSLSFLAQAPLTSQLNKLSLWYCQALPVAELRHVHALHGLRELLINCSFNEQMDADCAALMALCPPSAALPLLECFSYSSADQWDDPPEEEQNGASAFSDLHVADAAGSDSDISGAVADGADDVDELL